MSRPLTAFAMIAALAACDDANPFQGGEIDGTPTDPPVIDPDNPIAPNGLPEALAGNLNAVAYNPGSGTLSVEMASLDQTSIDYPLAQYTENLNLTTPALQSAGYQVYSYQDDGLDRMFVAIVAESNDGSVQGAVVMDGGQFLRFFGGGVYATDGTFTPGVPENDTGLVSYAGTYGGLSNLDADGAELIGVPPIPEDDDGSLLPAQPAQLEGGIFLNADFGDNTINGAIIDRSWTNLNPVLAAIPTINDLEDVFLLPADITDAGTFFGTTSVVIDGDESQVGSYGGAFGGIEAPGVAGVVHLDGDYIEDIENEEEFGVFVLTQCGQPGEASLCDFIPVNP
ncbi:MAG: hypothetical protein AAGL89_05145 [Pseudomonadota bacterium]